MRSRIALIFVILCLVSSLVGCSPQADRALAPEVQALMEARSAGVNGGDASAYLKTVLPSDGVLYKEESNLIRAAGTLDISGFDIAADDIKKTDNGCTARLSQTYTLGGIAHSCTYMAAFVREGGTLYYAGPAFITKQNERVKVHYQAARERLAGEILEAETEILDAMREQLGFTPKGFISVKLFEDQPVFLQSIKLDLPTWVGGWHEYGEAVKTFVGAYGTDVETYRSMLAHESTHRMASELSNDNAAYWLQEGLAGVYQELLLNPDADTLSQDEAMQAFSPFAGQKTIDLEKLDSDDGGAVSLYYASSKAYTAFLVEEYGWEKMKQALDYMRKFELIAVTGAEKMAETNARTDEALASVFGFGDDKAFQNAFDHWLESKK